MLHYYIIQQSGGVFLFLLLEDGGVILMEKIVALVRHDGKTTITLRDNSARESAFTPMTLDRRRGRLRRKTR
jgi:hypothetical protein